MASAILYERYCAWKAFRHLLRISARRHWIGSVADLENRMTSICLPWTAKAIDRTDAPVNAFQAMIRPKLTDSRRQLRYFLHVLPEFFLRYRRLIIAVLKNKKMSLENASKPLQVNDIHLLHTQQR